MGGSNKNRFLGFRNRNLFLIYFLAFLAAGFFAAFLAGLVAFLTGAFFAAGLAVFLAGAFSEQVPIHSDMRIACELAPLYAEAKKHLQKRRFLLKVLS